MLVCDVVCCLNRARLRSRGKREPRMKNAVLSVILHMS